jgi:hypothetical protein
MFSAQDSEALPWFNTHFSRHTVQGSENEMAAFVDDPVGLLRLFHSGRELR